MKRRKFIQETSRWSLLGGLLTTSGFLLYRRRFGDPENCFKNPFCQSCNQFSGCSIVANPDQKNNEGAKKQ